MISLKRKLFASVTFPDPADDPKITNIFAGGNCSFAVCTSDEVPTQIHTTQAMMVEGIAV